MTPTLSICIAAYNVESYISECLESIFQFENSFSKEIIIVDDCSNDTTVKIVRSMIEKYGEENITLIENQQNLWPAGSYNMAVQNAHGKYITFLDSDDFLIASGLSKKIEMLESNRELQVVYGNGVFFEKWTQGLQIQEHMDRLLAWSIWDIQKKFYTTIPMLSVSCSVIRRDFFDEIGGFDTMCQSNDWVINIRIFQHLASKKNFSYVFEPVFAYRMHENNISKDSKKMIKLLREVVDHYIPLEYKDKQYANIYFFTALNGVAAHRYMESFRLFRISLSFEYHLSRIFIYILALVSPVSFIARHFPKLFSFLKKCVQRFTI